MKEYKNKYKGNRLFVVGNGKSLIDTPLNKLTNEYSFGMNRIGMIFNKTIWRPSFFFCITYRVKMSVGYKEDVYDVIKTGIPCFIGKRIRPELCGHNNIHYINSLHIGKKFAEPKKEYWNRDISDNKVSVYGQSLFSVMQIAVYMGFNPIYLVGIDGYKPNKELKDKNHFDSNYETPNQRHNIKWFNEYGLPTLINSHKLIYNGTREMGVNVFDATVVENNMPYTKVELEEIL